MNVTKLEEQVLLNIKNSEYQDGTPLALCTVWSFTATNETKQLAGALGSCVKKGLAECYTDDCDGNGREDETCTLTQKGVDYLESIGEEIW